MGQTFLWPWSLLVLLGFGVVFAIILHTAVARGVYRITGVRALDYPFSWMLGLATGCTPMVLYVAMGFDEFAKTPAGSKLRDRIRGTAWLELGLWVLYALAVFTFVPQK